MPVRIDVTYRDGVFVPVKHVDFPEGAQLRFVLETYAAETPSSGAPATGTEEILTRRPTAQARPSGGRSAFQRLIVPMARFQISGKPLRTVAYLAGAILLGAVLVPELQDRRGTLSAVAQPFWAVGRRLRDIAADNLSTLTILVPAIGCLLVVLWLVFRPRDGIAPAALLLGLVLAMTGEMLILQRKPSLGAAAFVSAALSFALGLGFARERLAEALKPVLWSRRRESFALLLVLALVFVTRFYRVGIYPYGVEGDESGWQYLVVESAGRVDGHRVYPLNRMPTSYWAQQASYALLGTNIVAARTGVAVLSFAGTVFFYFAARQMFNIPIALLATYLMGISIVDLAASRDAHVEAYVKVFALLAVLAMLLAYRPGQSVRRKASMFALSGAALALGMMTYDNFAFVPLPLFLYAVYRMFRERQAWRSHLVGITAMLVPLLVIAPPVYKHLRGRRISQVAVLTAKTGVFVDSWESAAKVLPKLPGFMKTHARAFADRMTSQMVPDVLLGRAGPLESAALVPLMLLGFVVAMVFWRRRHNTFLLLWLLIPLLPSVLLLGQTSARIFLPYWGAFLILAALALYVPYTLIRSGIPRAPRRVPIMVLALFLAGVGLSNLYAYFHELADPPDRQRRRELGDLLAAHIGSGRMVYLPYVPMRGDFVDAEKLYQQVVVRDSVPHGADDDFFRSVPYARLLEEISRSRAQPLGIRILYDKAIVPAEERARVLEAFRRCYPDHTIQRGRFFDVYSASGRGLASSRCYFARINPVRPADENVVEPDKPVRLEWGASKGTQTSYVLELERQNDRVIWIEAERWPVGAGWEVQAILAPGFNDRGYLTDVTHTGLPATHGVEIPVTGRYEVWTRTFRRRDDRSPLFLQFAGRPLEIGRADSTYFQRWRWESLGEFDLPKGKTQFAFSRQYDWSADPWSMLIDTVVLSRQSGFEPDRGRNWEPVVIPRESASAARDETVRPLERGRYRWRVKVMDGQRLLDWDGSRGATSRYAYFRVGS